MHKTCKQSWEEFIKKTKQKKLYKKQPKTRLSEMSGTIIYGSDPGWFPSHPEEFHFLSLHWRQFRFSVPLSDRTLALLSSLKTQKRQWSLWQNEKNLTAIIVCCCCCYSHHLPIKHGTEAENKKRFASTNLSKRFEVDSYNEDNKEIHFLAQCSRVQMKDAFRMLGVTGEEWAQVQSRVYGVAWT